MDLSVYVYIILILAAFSGGFVDSIAGGGGTITVPVLLSVGIPPHVALATNKLQSSFGTLAAVLNLKRKGLIEFKKVSVGMMFTLIGAVSGSYTIELISAEFLNIFAIIMLIIVLIFLLLNRKLGEDDRAKKMNSKSFYTMFGLLLGFYDGFFGPGTGSFWVMSLILLLGVNLKSASVQSRVFNLVSNLSALAVFSIHTPILYKVGLTMALAQIVGATIGSNLLIKVNIKFIKKFFIIVIFLVILKLIYDNFIAK